MIFGKSSAYFDYYSSDLFRLVMRQKLAVNIEANNLIIRLKQIDKYPRKMWMIERKYYLY